MKRTALVAAVETAISIADQGDSTEIPDDWVRHVKHIDEAPNKTYGDVLGTALLARSAYGTGIDPLALKTDAGSKGYSARSAAGILAEKARAHGYHMNSRSPEPLNARPFIDATRVDRIRLDGVQESARPYLGALKSYLKEAGSLSKKEAEQALAAFISVRREVAKQAAQSDTEDLEAPGATLATISEAALSLVRAFPEKGRTAQALAAAALGTVCAEVELGAIHDPDAIDVLGLRLKSDKNPFLAVQVKQKRVTEDSAAYLAEAASELGATAALLVAIAKDQPALNQEAIAANAVEHGVTAMAVESVPALLNSLGIFSGRRPEEIADQLPEAFLRRLKEIDASDSAMSYWRELIAGLS